MLFTSYGFLGFFIVLFLLYYMIPGKYQWMLLLAASWLFYCFASPKYLPYLLGVTVLTYAAALGMSRSLERQKQYLKEHKPELDREGRKRYKQAQLKKRRRWLAGSIVLVLGILAAAKYMNFFIAGINGILEAGKRKPLSFWELAMPLGISFYTLRAIGYLVDVYRESIEAEKSFFRFALFLSFFPLLIQGPVSRYGDLAETLYEGHSADRKRICCGLQRMLWGYFKKLVIADRILAGVSVILGAPETYQGAYLFAGMLLYTIELYADFTGGIDITIGIAQTLGISVQENFNRPYFSKSLKEYWRRWHISMCSWFREYVFYPVSVSPAMQKFAKWGKAHFGGQAGKRLPVYVSSFIVWFATGLWHGASWNFIVWGLLNWAVLMVSEELEPLYARFHRRFSIGGKWIYKAFMTARTFLLICVLNLFDCYESAGTTLRMLASVFRAGNWSVLTDGSLLFPGITAADYCIAAAGVAVVFSVSLLQRRGSMRDRIARLAYPLRVSVWFGLFLAVLIFGAYGIGYDANQFIYNRF